MLGIQNVIKSLIMFIFTLILIANILYAFNINAAIGGTLSGIDVNSDLSNSYFGISTFLENWNKVYENSSGLHGLGSALQSVSKFMQRMNITEYAQRNYEVYQTPGANMLVVLASIANTLFNIVWIIASFAYFFILIMYIIGVIFSFLSFILTFISGFASTALPVITYPDVQPLEIIRYCFYL